MIIRFVIPSAPMSSSGWVGVMDWPLVPRQGDVVVFNDSADRFPQTTAPARCAVDRVEWTMDGVPIVILKLWRNAEEDINALRIAGFVTRQEWMEGRTP